MRTLLCTITLILSLIVLSTGVYLIVKRVVDSESIALSARDESVAQSVSFFDARIEVKEDAPLRSFAQFESEMDDMGDLEERVVRDGVSLDGELLDRDPASVYWRLREQRGLLSVERYDTLLKEVLFSWALQDPFAAQEHVEELVSEDLRAHILRGIANGLANRSVEEAIAWLESSVGARLSDEVYEDCWDLVLHRYAIADPVAASLIVKNSDSEELQKKTVGHLVEHYANRNLSHALDWVLGLERESVRNIGLSRIMLRVNRDNAMEVWTAIAMHQSKLSDRVFSFAYENVYERLLVPEEG